MNYRIPKYTISLVRDSSISTRVKRITTSLDAEDVIRAVLQGTDREQFIVLCLDGKNNIIGVNVVSTGSLSMSIVHPREAFKAAILANSCSIIIAHNHPSGDPTPSPEDNALTKRLVDCGKLLGITVLDHIIVGDGTEKSYSYADSGNL